MIIYLEGQSKRFKAWQTLVSRILGRAGLEQRYFRLNRKIQKV